MKMEMNDLRWTSMIHGAFLMSTSWKMQMRMWNRNKNKKNIQATWILQAVKIHQEDVKTLRQAEECLMELQQEEVNTTNSDTYKVQILCLNDSGNECISIFES